VCDVETLRSLLEHAKIRLSSQEGGGYLRGVSPFSSEAARSRGGDDRSELSGGSSSFNRASSHRSQSTALEGGGGAGGLHGLIHHSHSVDLHHSQTAMDVYPGYSASVSSFGTDRLESMPLRPYFVAHRRRETSNIFEGRVIPRTKVSMHSTKKMQRRRQEMPRN